MIVAPGTDAWQGRVLQLTATDSTIGRLEAVTKALGSDKRLAILQYLASHTCSVLEIAEALQIPASTATLHVNVLEAAGLITTDLQPATRGLQKVCARVYDQVHIHLPTERPEPSETLIEVSMPIGAYVDCTVMPTCGLAGEMGVIGMLDEPATFFEPERIYAQLIWFHHGFVEYRFPNRMPPGAVLESLEISFEACSESPLHHDNWPSDITVAVNRKELGTWTSPADFGGQHGVLTPHWWDNENTQYGLLKVWKVTAQGSYVDGVRVSGLSIVDLDLAPGRSIGVTIGVKETAQHVGGINLFGRGFGNYPQDIVLKMRLRRSAAARPAAARIESGRAEAGQANGVRPTDGRAGDAATEAWRGE
jgi:predicted transcriptional regulator